MHLWCRFVLGDGCTTPYGRCNAIYIGFEAPSKKAWKSGWRCAMGKIWQLSETFDDCLKHLLNFWHRWGGTSVPFTRKQPIHVTWWCAIIHDPVAFEIFTQPTPRPCQLKSLQHDHWSMQLRLPYSNTEKSKKNRASIYLYSRYNGVTI